MQAKSHQQKYVCPYCAGGMKHDVNDSMGVEVHHIYCINEECDVEGVNWDIKKLESFECNKIVRVEELLDAAD